MGILLIINSMLNHVAFLNPRSPNSMLSLCHGILPKVVSALFTTLNWGGEGETKFVLAMFNNFVILAGMVSRVLSKIKAVTLEPKAKCPLFKTRGSIKWFPVCLSFDIAVRMSQS
jgi:hypothetical protein